MYRNTHRAPSESTRPHIGPHHIAYFRVHSCARGDACQSCGRQVMCARRLQGCARGTQAGEVPVAARLSGLIVLGPIRLVQTRDLRHQRIVCRIPTRRQRERPARAQPRRGARRHWSTGTHGFRAGGGGRGAGGAPGFGSVNSEHTDSSTLEIVSAGLHWLCKMSRQMLPLLFTLQW